MELSGQFLKANQPMEKDASGDWSVTVGPVEPNLYPYHFVVDGLNVADPGNAALFPNERFKSSLIDIPAKCWPEPAAACGPKRAARRAALRLLSIEGAGHDTAYVVYTPPGCLMTRARPSYPVLYLVSGTTDTEETWYRAGRSQLHPGQPDCPEEGGAHDRGHALWLHVAAPSRATRRRPASCCRCLPTSWCTACARTSRPTTAPARARARGIAGFSRGGTQSMFTPSGTSITSPGWRPYASYIPPVVLDATPRGFAKP